MSFADVLVESAVQPIAAERDLEQLHSIAYTSQHDWTTQPYHEVIHRIYPLDAPYKYVAWAAVGAVYDAALSTDDTELVPRTKYLADASAAGIFGMVRYLSNLPFIYAASRAEHADMPESVSAQVKELGEIALRDNAYIATLAGQSVQVSGRVERDDYLRGELPGNPMARLEDMKHLFVLRDGLGLRVTTRFNLQERIERVKNWYHFENPEGRDLDRAAGCLALHVTDSEGVSVFDKTWASLVRVAVEDSRFFQADLERLRERQAEREFAI